MAASGDFLARKVLVQCLVATLQDIMAVLHSCCFKFSLKTGTMIIGALLFSFSIIFLLVNNFIQCWFFVKDQVLKWPLDGVKF